VPAQLALRERKRCSRQIAFSPALGKPGSTAFVTAV
jgi:hypothetical protein